MNLLKKLGFGGKTPKVRAGKLIVVEGIDGSGKTLQVQHLARTLTEEGYSVGTINFPSYTGPLSEPLSAHIKGEVSGLDPHGVAMLYALDRAQAREQISEMLQSGKMVIANRFSASNAAYQGLKLDQAERPTFYRWVDQMEHTWFSIPRPDYTFVLDMPASFASQLQLKRRIERTGETENKDFISPELDKEYLASIRENYRTLAQLWPNMRLISCTENGQLKTPADIHNELWPLCRRLALKIDGLKD